MLLFSCTNNDTYNEIEHEDAKKEVAVEILQAKKNSHYTTPVLDRENAEFLDGEYIKNLPAMMRTKSLINPEEGVLSADEIPISNRLELTQVIYHDGSFDFVQLDKTIEEMNFIESLNLYPVPENEKVYKTEIKDNNLYLYNSSGGLIKSEQIANIDFKPMLDSLYIYLENLPDQPDELPRQLTKRKTTKILEEAINSGMRVVRQTSNEIVLELDLGTSESSFTQRVKGKHPKKAVMSFSPDLQRMFSQKIFEGEQLVQLLEIGYADEHEEQFSNSLKGFKSDLLPNTNIKFTKQKTLMEDPDGVPYILNNDVIYTKNIVKYNLHIK